MIEHDEELRRVLRVWEAPAPGPALDDRVWSTVRQKPKRPVKWFGIAAGVLLAGLVMHLWQGGNGDHSNRGDPGGVASIETRVNADGFLPLSNGAITVVKVKLETKQ